MNTLARRLILALSLMACTGAAPQAHEEPAPAPSEQPSQRADDEDPGPEESMGELDDSPTTIEHENFRVRTATSKREIRFYVHLYTTRHEGDGPADPQRPDGPDNIKVETTEHVDVFAIDGKGQVIPRTELPKQVQALHAHLETHKGIASGGVVTPIADPAFADRLIEVAAAEHALTVQKRWKD